MDKGIMSRTKRQTVQLAIDTKVGELVAAESLLALDEETFTAMRRSAMIARNERNRGGSTKPWICACCQHPLYISRHNRPDGNRWFVHDRGAPPECPFHEGRRLSEEQTRAIIYRGQQEGAAHKKLKDFLAKWLTSDPDVADVRTEATTFSEVIAGEWRRPDVKCFVRGVPVVFELQLSYTFLSVVIERDEFYRRAGINIIWVFQAFDRNRAVIADEAFFNRRNLFVLDNEATAQTEDAGVLLFSGWHQRPRFLQGCIQDVWTHRFVGLRDIRYPTPAGRPFYWDYAAARQAIIDARVSEQMEASRRSWEVAIQAYVQAVMDSFASDEREAAQERIELCAGRVSEHERWLDRDPQLLTAYEFVSYRGLLPVLLTLKLDRAVGYGYQEHAVFQTLNNLLINGSAKAPRPFAALILRAYRVWQPPSVKPEHHKRIVAEARRIRQAIDAGDPRYRQDNRFNALVSELFPELRLQQLSQATRREVI